MPRLPQTEETASPDIQEIFDDLMARAGSSQVSNFFKVVGDNANVLKAFVSAFYGILTPSDGTFVYANAGRPRPIVVRHSDGRVKELRDSTGLVLAVLKDSAYQEAHTVIGPGDRVVFYTDGVTESFNKSQLMYGHGRLMEAAVSTESSSAEELLRSILDDRARFVSGGPTLDDSTMVVVVREPHS
jgi:sigma-B regulation protein RsbU (phosphoserine phosphatase)